MAKPEEILISENETGEVVREITVDTDSNLLYKKMKKIFSFLAHFDPEFTQLLILKKLTLLFEKHFWDRTSLSTICWSIGSISGVFPVEEEKKFLVNIIKDLLYLCELKKGKDNKAVIACNIMFVVGAYPQFLQHHWKFLKTVLQKLFEFMKEPHPGIQDMASDTFLKIGKSCAKKISSYHEKGESPLIEEILEKGKKTLGFLKFRQKKQFFESLGIIVFSIETEDEKNFFIGKIFTLLNSEWFSFLKYNLLNQKMEWFPQISMIFKLNKLLGEVLMVSYSPFLVNFLKEIHFVYSWTSEKISKERSLSGKTTLEEQTFEILKNLRKDFLGLIQVYFSNIPPTLDIGKIKEQFYFFVEPILLDYKTFSRIQLKEPDVLDFCKNFLVGFKKLISREMFRIIFSNTFIPSLNFIKTNFEENVEIKKKFFSLAQIMVLEFYPEIFKLDDNPTKAENLFELVINCFIWGFKHSDNVICRISLNSFLELIFSIDQKILREYFFYKFAKQIMTDLFAVIIDGLHCSCFKLQSKLFFILLQVSKEFLEFSDIQVYVSDLFSNAFPEMKLGDLENLVLSLVQKENEEEFLKKFLFLIKMDINLQEESSGEN